MDERSNKIVTRAMALTLSLLYVLLFVSCLWKYVTTRDITTCTTELILIVLIPASIIWFSRKDERLLIPKMSVTGQEMPTELNKENVSKRKKLNFLDSIGLATIFLLMEILDSLFIQKEWSYFTFVSSASETVNVLITLLIEYVVMIVVFSVIKFVWDEWKVRKYNRKLDELEGN